MKLDLEILGTESHKEILERAVGGPPQKMAPFPPQDGGEHREYAGRCDGMPVVACPCCVTLARSLDISGPRFVTWNLQGQPSRLASLVSLRSVCFIKKGACHKQANGSIVPLVPLLPASSTGTAEAAWLKVTETVRWALIPYVITKLLVIDLVRDVTSTLFAFHTAPSFSPCLSRSWTLRSAAERSF